MKKAVLVLLFILGLAAGCKSPYYWSSTSTIHGEKAQQKYIHNQKGHKPEKRFMRGQSTFGYVGSKKTKH